VTGAPKIRAMSVIRDLEERPRGWYCGSLGVLRPGGEAVFNVTIRTLEERDGWTTCGIGSGIVADSEPAAELAEWRAKTRFLGGEPLSALETMLLEDGQFPHLERHLGRLARTDAELGLGVDLAAARDRLAQVVAEFPSGRWRVRLTAREGDVSAEVSALVETPVPVRLAIAGEPLDVEALRPVIAHKTTWRAHYDRLRGLAPAGMFDVICHTPDGVVTETTLGNLALELDGRWVTPPVTAGLLPGVERAHWLARGRLVEAEVTLADLGRATGLALLNGVRGWLPAVLVDGGITPIE
jgi:para-aminobenzoate synthetase/4-amino-4-deoxychorismate lyase